MRCDGSMSSAAWRDSRQAPILLHSEKGEEKLLPTCVHGHVAKSRAHARSDDKVRQSTPQSADRSTRRARCPRLVRGCQAWLPLPHGRSNVVHLAAPIAPRGSGKAPAAPVPSQGRNCWGEQRALPSAHPGRAIPREQEQVGCTVQRGGTSGWRSTLMARSSERAQSPALLMVPKSCAPRTVPCACKTLATRGSWRAGVAPPADGSLRPC